jgi:quinol monooxygenase YgiN
MPRVVIALYRPKPGQHDALMAAVREHVPTLQRLGLATSRQPTVMRASDGTVLEIFEWASQEAIDRAHHDATVAAMWQRFGEACDFVPLGTLAEATQMFPDFEPL